MTVPLCYACRAIDFATALSVPAIDLRTRNPGTYDNPGILLDRNANRFAQSSSTGCRLCRLLASTLCSCEDEWSDPGVQELASRHPYELTALSFIRNCVWTPGDVEAAQDCHILLSPRGVSSSSGDFSKWAGKEESGYVVCLPKQRAPGLFVPEEISESFDITKAKLWLQHCKWSHGDSCNKYLEAVPGMEAIDCHTLKIVQAELGAPWVGLSYVWGHNVSQVDDHDLEPGSLPRGVSRTVQDAIEVTKSLGYRYLWVDRYCINQQNEDQKRKIIAKMDVVYRGADLTIVAAAGHDEHFGLPGVGGTSRKKQDIVELESWTVLSTGPDPVLETRRSRWWTRGWTFQEGILSRRRLIFTEHQCWFECHEGSWMEALGGLEHVENPNEVQWGSEEIGGSLNSWLLSYHQKTPSWIHPDDAQTALRLDQFALLVKEYSGRQLTFDTDSLNAFAGVSRHLRESHPQVTHMFGVPYMLSIDAPDGPLRVEKYMFYFLCWHHRRATSPRRRQDFPSWTWAGWAGQVGWMTGRLSGVRALEQKMKNIRFELMGKKIAQEHWNVVLDLVNYDNYGLEGSSLVLCFEAQVVPSSMFSWNTYEETRESESDEDGDEDDSDNANPEKESDSAPPDPDDWNAWTVGDLELWDRSQPPDCGPLAFIEHIEKGEWGCLLLGDYNGNAGYSRRRFMLVVEWLEDGLSRRVGSVVLNKHYYLDAKSEFFDATDLSWRSVRLI